MIIKYLIPLMAMCGVGLAVRTVILAAEEPKVVPPLVEPARAPFDSYLSGAGIVEARTENVAIAATVPGVVTAVAVRVGQSVKAGDALFSVDVRDLEAQLDGEHAAFDAARARIARLEALPRVEDLRLAEAKQVESQSALSEARDQLALADAITDPRALSRDERNRRRSAVDIAQARFAATTAALDWQKGGAWKPDLAVARAEAAQAEARVKSMETQIARATVRAAFDATVLQVNVRPGEYAPTGVLARPLMTIGATDVLHVRVDIDENDAWRFRSASRAVAFLRGNRDFKADLKLVRVEPYVVPKRSLTGESTERVDTRVLQVLYQFDPKELGAYVGQQVDAFIEAAPLGTREGQ